MDEKAASSRPGLRAQVVVLAVAVVVAGVGAIIWSRTTGPGAADELVVLDRHVSDGIDPRFINADHVGAGLPAANVENIDGERVALATSGEPLVVNIWNTACGPCSRELPAFAAVAAEYAGEVRFVGVNPLDPIERMTEFAAARGVGYDLYRDTDYELFDALDVVAFPLTLFVAADGTIVAQANVLSEPELRDLVAHLAALG